MKNNILSLENFGPIKKAEINMAPLTIFIGPNSSGKSFSAALIHSLLNSFNMLGLNRYEYIRNKSVNLFLENNDELFKEFKHDLIQYVNSKPKVSDEPFKFSTVRFKTILKESFGQVFQELVEEKLKETFSNNLNKLNRLKRYPFEFSFNDNVFSNENGLLSLNKFFVDMNRVKDEGLSSEDTNICFFEIDDEFLYIYLNYVLWDNFFEGKTELFVEIVFMMIVSSVMDTFNQTSYYIPAIGDEVFNDINTFISDDIKGNLQHSLLQKELLVSFLKVKEDINQSPFYQLAENLEQEIIGGKLTFKKGEIKEEFVFIDNDNDLELELGLTSSSIRELMPLIIYLKYFLKKEDTLIIEEPENHIHPKNQLILVKYLVKAINMGLNMVITTHSDYIVEQFNNFIRLSNSKEEIFEKFGYDESNILDYHDVNIYNFKSEDKYGFIVQAVEINETGFDEDSFYEVHSQLYNESVDIIEGELE